MYKLVEVATGNIVAYGDEPTTVFGGEWGRYDESGNPLYVWQEVIPTDAELKSEALSALTSQFNQDMESIRQWFVDSVMDEDSTGQEDMITYRQDVITQYLADLDAIMNS